MHISRCWINPKWLKGKYKVNLNTKKKILYCRQVCTSKDRFWERLWFTNVQKTPAKAYSTQPKERLWLGRIGFRPNIALSWFWHVINRKFCCIDVNHNWIFIGLVPNLCLYEIQNVGAKVPYQSICKYAFWWNQRIAEFRGDRHLVLPKPGRHLTLHIGQWLKTACKGRHFSCSAAP